MPMLNSFASFFSIFAMQFTSSFRNPQQKLIRQIIFQLKGSQGEWNQEHMKSLRVSQLKRILELENVNVKGIFDRHDFEQLLIKTESDWLKQRVMPTTLPINYVSLGAENMKYVGINVEIKQIVYQFMVDTGASMNLIRQDIANALSLNYKSEAQFTQGLGGGGVVAAAKAFIEKATVGSKTLSFEVAILDNPSALPPSASGLLGLSFLKSLGGVADFDFVESQFQFGSLASVLSPLQKQKFKSIRLFRIFSGLIACDVYITLVPNGKPVKCIAMLDLGSTYTIINSAAITAGGSSIEQLPESKMRCMGIDGRPMKLRAMSLQSFCLDTEDGLSIPSVKAFAADIPGLSQIGLGSVPALILGIDVLGRNRMLLDLEKDVMYLPMN